VGSKEIKNQIESTFDNVSDRYDENRFFSISAKGMVEFLPVDGVTKILDVSSGTGIVAMELAEKYSHAQIDAIDLSQGMLQIAQTKAEKNGINNIKFIQCDAECLPYEKATFDIITCGYGLFFYPEMESTYQALCKIIEHGGMFIFSSFTSDAFSPYADVFFERLEKDYKIEAPKALRERLKTTQQIEELALSSKPLEVEVKYYPIRYSITIMEWWSLLNNAGYKGLIDKLNEEELTRFKKSHLKEIESIAMGSNLELNADSYFGLVHL